MNASDLSVSQPGQLQWFAVQVRTLRETRVAQLLAERGYEQFLPLRIPARGESRGAKALFPGYLFCRLNLEDRRVPVVTVPGVIGFVGVAGRPEPIPNAEVSSLINIIAAQVSNECVSLPQSGEKVRILQGPLRGVEGILCRVRNQSRLLVGVPLLQRAVSVEMHPSWIAADDNPDAYAPLRLLAMNGQTCRFSPCVTLSASCRARGGSGSARPFPTNSGAGFPGREL
jgi:transcription antitermination factor NusG